MPRDIFCSRDDKATCQFARENPVAICGLVQGARINVSDSEALRLIRALICTSEISRADLQGIINLVNTVN